MAHASPVASSVDRDPQNGCCHSLCGQGESQLPSASLGTSPKATGGLSNYLLYQRTATELGVRAREILCLTFKSRVSVPYSLPALLNNKPHWFPSQASWGPIFTVADPWAEKPHVECGPLHSSGRASVFVISLLFVGRWLRGTRLDQVSFILPTCLMEAHGKCFPLGFRSFS